MADATVCVTGAGGFVASWLVQELLTRGYAVHGTVRDPDAQKNAHLKKMQHGGKLKLFKADVLDSASIAAAVAGCGGVFHVASPVVFTPIENPEEEMLSPAVTGTLNVLNASKDAGVRRVVFVSSISAVIFSPGAMNSDSLVDESSWSDEDFCRSLQWWYAVSKTMAERKVWEFAAQSGLDVVAVCPSVVTGPLLQAETNSTTDLILNILKLGSEAKAEDLGIVLGGIVDVGDLADALILVYEKAEASGRYICSSSPVGMRELVARLQDAYPGYSMPSVDVWSSMVGVRLSSRKLEALGWRSRPIDDIWKRTVEFYLSAGLLPAAGKG